MVGETVTYNVRFETTYDVGNENGTFFFMTFPSGLSYEGSALSCGVGPPISPVSGVC